MIPREIAIEDWLQDLATALHREYGGDLDQQPPTMTFGDARFRVRIAGSDVIFEIDVASSPSGLACVTRPITWRQYRAGHIARELIVAYDELRGVEGVALRTA